MQIETGTDELRCEIRDRVATITLNRPEKRNALGDRLSPAFRQALLDVELRPDVGCVLVTGEGRAFCSGGDVGGMGAGAGAEDDGPRMSVDERVADLTRRQEALTLRLYELAKPTVAALPGAAAGAGCSIALACDLRVASPNAFLVTGFARIGLSGDYGASWLLNRLLGQGKAKELMFLGERISAEAALGLGLVNAIFPEASFREDAFAYARRLAHGPTLALSRMKRNLNRAPDQDLRASLALEAEHMIASFQTDDAKEAIRAFGEKREPVFRAR